MDDSTQSSGVVFLFGAGASVPAGVPDTVSFVTDFVNHLDDGDAKRTVKKVIEILKKWKNRDAVDVELLLETLTKLESKESEPLLQFYENCNFLLENYPAKKPIVEQLKDFIRSRGIVSEDKVRYLDPLLDMVREYGRIDIISLNYDTCVEQFCNIHRLRYQDGFDLHWNPTLFDDKEAKMRLLKLHGSITWYKTSHSDYMKLPLKNVQSKVELITGETAEGLVLYPMQKLDYSGPNVELLVEAKKIIESPACKFLVVVGYSFRDDNIRSIVWDAAGKNESLIVLLIDPKANDIFQNRLKYFDESKTIPSMLSGRTVCLPYDFSKMFPSLSTQTLNPLSEGLNEESKQHENRIKGITQNWMTAANSFLDSGYVSRAETLMTDAVAAALLSDKLKGLSILFKAGFLALLGGQSDSPYLSKFFELLREYMVQRINVQCVKQPFMINLSFDWRRISDTGSSSTPCEYYLKMFRELNVFSAVRSQWRFNNEVQNTQALENRLHDLIEYLLQIEALKSDVNSYASTRYGPRNGVFLHQHYEPFQQGSSGEEIERQIKNTELNLLKPLLKWKV